MAGSNIAEFAASAERSPPDHLFVEPRWYACYTRARSEKQVARLLSERHIESYLPTLPQTRQWKDRTKLVAFPLFPSYVFGRFTLRDVHAVLTTPGISTIVRTRGVPTPIPDAELENVRRVAEGLMTTGSAVVARPFFAEGERVRVAEGPFEGVEGFVIEMRNRRRVLVGIAAIGQGLEIDIDARLLRTVRNQVQCRRGGRA